MDILVVDDNRALLRSLEIVLSQKGHLVKPCVSVTDALSFLQEGYQPDVLLIDYFIGSATGCEILAAFKQHILAGCLTLVMTGHREQIDVDRMHFLGVDDVLAKPLDLCELTKIVAAM